MTNQTFSIYFFLAKGTIYYVTIATLIFSYFHVGRYHVLALQLIWYFINVHTKISLKTW